LVYFHSLDQSPQNLSALVPVGCRQAGFHLVGKIFQLTECQAQLLLLMNTVAKGLQVGL
jgi:hypothetical protein